MTISADPTYPVAGEAVEVTSGASQALVTHYAIELTSVPSQSSLATGLQTTQEAPAGIAPIAAAKAGQLAETFTPDVPGEYGVSVYLIRRKPPVAPGQVEARWDIKTTDSGTVQVGQLVELPLATVRLGGCTLRLRINESTIRAASLRDFSDDSVRIAALDSGVVAALAALEGVAVATALGSNIERLNDLIEQYEAHRSSAVWHSSADNENTITRFDAHSPASLVDTFNEALVAILDHMTERSTGTRYHTTDDTRNTPLTGTVSTVAGVTVGLSDLRERVYERHRVQGSGDTPAVHTTAGGDTGNALSAPTLLDDVIVSLFDVLADASPTAPDGEVDGAVTAAAAGFRIVT